MPMFLVPDDFRAFMKQVVRTLDARDAAIFLDAEDALQHETGYGGRVDGAEQYRFTYIAKDGGHKWELPLSEAAIREIADGLLIEVAGEQIAIARTHDRPAEGHPLLIWGEYGDDALVVHDRAELVTALDGLRALAESAPRMLRAWSRTDDQVVAMLRRDDCALYVIESLDGYGTSCGADGNAVAFALHDHDGRPVEVPLHDCVPWPVAREALATFVERGELGPAIRLEGRIPSGLLMLGDVDRRAALAARGEAPPTLARSSLPRMLSPSPEVGEQTLDDEHELPSTPGVIEAPARAEELSAWARRLIELLYHRALIELTASNLDEIAYRLGGLLQAHGQEAQHSPETAEWLANEIGAVPGIAKLFATGGDLQILLRRSRM